MADSGITCCLGPVYRENPDFRGRKTLGLGKGLDKNDWGDEDAQKAQGRELKAQGARRRAQGSRFKALVIDICLRSSDICLLTTEIQTNKTNKTGI